ncbi:transposase [Streptomyces sp. NPDC001020]
MNGVPDERVSSGRAERGLGRASFNRVEKARCQPCPDRPRCTTSRERARNVGFPPRELRDLQVRVRNEQQTPEWKTHYAVRSGVEGTIKTAANGSVWGSRSAGTATAVTRGRSLEGIEAALRRGTFRAMR